MVAWGGFAFGAVTDGFGCSGAVDVERWRRSPTPGCSRQVPCSRWRGAVVPALPDAPPPEEVWVAAPMPNEAPTAPTMPSEAILVWSRLLR